MLEYSQVKRRTPTPIDRGSFVLPHRLMRMMVSHESSLALRFAALLCPRARADNRSHRASVTWVRASSGVLLTARVHGMCSARATKTLREFVLKAGDGQSVREAIAVGRQLRVVVLEYV